MNELQLAEANDRLLTAARNLVQAKAQQSSNQNFNIQPYFNQLEEAVKLFEETAFDDWCMDVDREAMTALGADPDTDGGFDWDYSVHFHQGLTTDQAGAILAEYLQQQGWTS